MNEWISVEDRLPDRFQPVLACKVNDYPFIARYDPVRGKWSVSHTVTVTVTHWMPLPEPTEEDNEMFYCNGKKDFCEDSSRCTSCEHKDGSGGEYRYVQQTNADRIRAMSDEELAEFLSQELPCEICAWPDLVLKWLQQPAEEDDHA